MTAGLKQTAKQPLKISKVRKRKEPITKNGVLNILRDYSAESSIHGIPYLGNNGHSTCGRVFWMITVCIALTCTLFQVIIIWHQWIDDPVVTTLDTISLPVEQIDFPAVTLCPQGSTEDIIDNVFYHQFEEWILTQFDDDGGSTRRKRLVKQTPNCECRLSEQRNMTIDALQCCFRDFLDDTFPGVYPNVPTKMATILNTENPDRAMELKTVVFADDEPHCNENDDLHILNDMNQKLQRICPEPFRNFNESTCFISSAEEMSYDEASSYCEEQGEAEIFFLGSFEDYNDLDVINGKLLYRNIENHRDV